jgi:hypothetical protein
MDTPARCTLFLALVLAAAAVVAADIDDIDRIVAAVGVDSMHSVDEVPRMRETLAQAFAAMNRKNPRATFPKPGSPEFDALVAQAVEGQQRTRRDPLVIAAYRATLAQMLSPTELAEAAAFYGSPVGRRAHIAVIEAEKAAAAAMEEVAGRQGR